MIRVLDKITGQFGGVRPLDRSSRPNSPQELPGWSGPTAPARPRCSTSSLDSGRPISGSLMIDRVVIDRMSPVERARFGGATKLPARAGRPRSYCSREHLGHRRPCLARARILRSATSIAPFRSSDWKQSAIVSAEDLISSSAASLKSPRRSWAPRKIGVVGRTRRRSQRR